MDDAPWPLPTTWRWCRFDEIARVASNLVNPANFPDWPHIAPNHIESETGKLLPYNTIVHDGVTSSKHRFSAGQVLYSKIRPYLAKVVVADFDGLCSADMYPIESELEARFLKWWMLSREFTRRAAGEQARTVLPKINVSALSGLPVPVPPISEQRRIVEILEYHLSRLDAAARLVSEISRRSAALKRSWLSNWLGNPEPDELFTVGDRLAEVRGGWSRGRQHEVTTGGVPYLKMNNITRNGRLDLTHVVQVTGPSNDVGRFAVRPGDVLFNSKNSGDLVGKTSVATAGVAGWTFNENIMRLRFDEGVIPEFAGMWFQGPQLRQAIRSSVKASTNVAAIYLNQLRQMPMWVPSVSTQASLLEAHDLVEVSIARVAEQLSTTQMKHSRLRRSLLSAAFSGRLT